MVHTAAFCWHYLLYSTANNEQCANILLHVAVSSRQPCSKFVLLVTQWRHSMDGVMQKEGGIVQKRQNESSCFLAWRLPSSNPRLFCKDTWVSSEITVLLSETLSQTPDLEKFTTTSRSRCQRNVVVVVAVTVKVVYDTYRTVDESWLFTTRRSTA